MAFADDFSDGPEEDPAGPLLPREDRIWRHPSELGAADQPFVLDPIQVRRRWLSSQPTRASAWTAGLVGALLATGLVVLGTHLASAFTTPKVPTPGAGLGGVTPARTSGSSGLSGTVSTMVATQSTEFPVSDSVAAMITRVAEATATIETSVGGRDAYADALVLSPSGDLLAPLSAVAGASSVLVTLPGQATYVGDVVATDPNAGVAVLRVRDAKGLRAAPFASVTPVNGEIVIAALGTGGESLAFGATVSAVGEVAGHAGWPIALTADVPPARAPAGTPLLDDQGSVVGIVMGPANGGVIALPAWLAAPVADDLAATGRVPHGWLGIDCGTIDRQGSPAGAQVDDIVGFPADGKLQKNDVITAIDGQPVTSYLALQSRLYALSPGTLVALTVQRAGQTLTIDLRLGGS